MSTYTCVALTTGQTFLIIYNVIKNSGLYDIITSIKCNILTQDRMDVLYIT